MKLINPIVPALIILFLSPLWGWSMAQVVIKYDLSHIIGFYLTALPMVLSLGYTFYWAMKGFDDEL